MRLLNGRIRIRIINGTIYFTLNVDLGFFVRIQSVVSDIALSLLLMPRLVAQIEVHQKVRYDEVKYGADDHEGGDSEEQVKPLEPNGVFQLRQQFGRITISFHESRSIGGVY